MAMPYKQVPPECPKCMGEGWTEVPGIESAMYMEACEDCSDTKITEGFSTDKD